MFCVVFGLGFLSVWSFAKLRSSFAEIQDLQGFISIKAASGLQV